MCIGIQIISLWDFSKIPLTIDVKDINIINCLCIFILLATYYNLNVNPINLSTLLLLLDTL